MLDHAANFFRITLHATIYFLFRYIFFFLYRQRNEHVVFERTYMRQRISGCDVLS